MLNMYHLITYNISELFRLNLIALRINYYYKYNIYLLFFLFLCIISSILIRSNIINEELLLNYLHNNTINIIITLLGTLAVIYSLKLIFDIINKCIQAYKIIPDFIKWFNNDIKNIKLIISFYYLQNIFFNFLSCWIIYIIIYKLYMFIEGIYLFIITTGILSKIIFLYYFGNKRFNIDFYHKGYPIWVYLILVFFILFYIIIFPLIILNIIESEKFIFLKNEFFKNCIKESYCYMDSDSQDSSTIRNSDESDRTINRNDTGNNTIRSNVSNMEGRQKIVLTLQEI